MAKGYTLISLGEIEELDAEDMDTIRTVLAYILMNSTDMESEDIYSLVFQDGKRITWH